MRNWRRGGTVQRATSGVVGLLLAVALLVATAPGAADAMCCVCRSCTGAAFCVDGIATSLTCAQLCVGATCNSTVYDAADICDGGCDGADRRTDGERPATHADHYADRDEKTGTQTATATPTATPRISGRIGYYVGDSPVAQATVALIAGTAAPMITTTDANGQFAFPSVDPGMQTLQPRKDGDFNIAVTTLDATLDPPVHQRHARFQRRSGPCGRCDGRRYDQHARRDAEFCSSRTVHGCALRWRRSAAQIGRSVQIRCCYPTRRWCNRTSPGSSARTVRSSTGRCSHHRLPARTSSRFCSAMSPEIGCLRRRRSHRSDQITGNDG